MNRMRRALWRALFVSAALALGLAASAQAMHNADRHSENASLLFSSQNSTGATNSDLAFWGDRAYAGNYDGFRIYDISDPASPALMNEVQCHGPQNDPIVWKNKLLFMAVDRTMTGPECGSLPTAEHDDPNGWEGVRIFDVSDPQDPEQIGSVYTDCGAHTITLYPGQKSKKGKGKSKGKSKSGRKLRLYVSSYPLRPGPTCGPVRGPEAGNSPLHEKISVISVDTKHPKSAKVIAQPRISYPGDPDGTFNPAEHGLEGFNSLTACHDIGVLVKKRLAAGACAEQVQLWKIKKNGIPKTGKPIWVSDDNTDADGPGGGDVAVDFWHTARFTWDGKYVQADDESFGVGCPTVTPGIGDTGRPHMIDASNGVRTSFFTLPRTESELDEEGNETAYCSMHQGNFVPTSSGYISVNAWYMGGINVIDWTDPANPVEVAYYDIAPEGVLGSDNWAAYWYEGQSLDDALTIYTTDGVHNPTTGKGNQVFGIEYPIDEASLKRLNPQTQETLIELGDGASASSARAGTAGAPSAAAVRGKTDRGAVLRRLAP